MIGKEEVKHIAKLARLGISSQEEKKFQKDLSSILDYIDSLNKADVSGVNPLYHPMEEFFDENVTREDIDQEQEIADKLIESAPDKKKRYIKVKSILK